MRKPTVGGHKGKVTTRARGAPVSARRMKDLIGEYAIMPTSQRRELCKQWVELHKAGVSFGVIAAEFNVAATTVCLAVKNPEKWVVRGKMGAVLMTGRRRSIPANLKNGRLRRR